MLKGVSLRVPEGGIVALLGANGAGKSTTLKAISGLLRTERGEVTKGTIDFLDQPIHRRDPTDIVRRGVVQVMEGRHVFEHLTVEDNLLDRGLHAGATAGRSAPTSSWSTGTSRASRTDAGCGRDTCRAASSRCWRSGER